jgi:hypothetical protein
MAEDVRGAEFGVIYSVTGCEFAILAIRSAKSMKDHHPEVSVTLFIDETIHRGTFGEFKLFDRIEYIENPEFNWNDKIHGIQNTPYKKTLYLDADTFVVRPVRMRFSTGFSTIRSTSAGRWGSTSSGSIKTTPSVSQFNTGVIAYEMTPEFEEFVSRWREPRTEKPEGHDQPTFREALLLSRIFYADIHPGYITSREVTSYNRR